MAQHQGITDINEYRKARRRAGTWRGVMMLVLLLTCLVAGYFFAISGFFTIQHVNITGNDHVSDERIMELSGVREGINIFAVDRKDAALFLEIEPRIGSAEVQRKLPGTVNITVMEREAVAVINTGHTMIEVDRACRVLDRYKVITSGGLPLISGMDLTGLGTVPGSIIESEQLDSALNILRAIPPEAEGIGEVNVADVQNIRLYTETGVEVRLGDDSDFETKYVIYSSILSSNETENGELIEYIDVSIPSVPAVATK